jgi:hypothetical protein
LVGLTTATLLQWDKEDLNNDPKALVAAAE